MEKLVKYLSPVFVAVTLLLVFWAMFTTPEAATVDNATAVGANLYWGYALMGVAVAVAVFAAIWDLMKKPEGIKGSLLSLVAIIAIVVVSYVIANGHDFQIVDLNNQGYFDRQSTVITDASILVTYVAFAAAIVVAIYSAVSDALK
ncbi:MAG: hypothetical protein J6Q31_03375 [Alistipes sp.]|nr:hypothetical protein [Alistipes sp.]MBO7194921.1 hypothetical protein [Alistipes sp.]